MTKRILLLAAVTFTVFTLSAQVVSANQEEKLAGQPSFDDLEMERGTVMVDRHGPMKTGLFEVSPTVEAPDGESVSKRSARKGRNPQTGKEIKIPARDGDGGNGAVVTVPIEVSELAKERKVKFFNEEKGYASIKDKESGEEYFVHVTGGIDEIRDEDDVSFDYRKNTDEMPYLHPIVEHLNTVQDEVRFELREGRKGMNAFDVRRTDLHDDGSNSINPETVGGIQANRADESRKEIKIPPKADDGEYNGKNALNDLGDKFDEDDVQAINIPIYLGDGWVCKYNLIHGVIVSCFHYEKLEGDEPGE